MKKQRPGEKVQLLTVDELLEVPDKEAATEIWMMTMQPLLWLRRICRGKRSFPAKRNLPIRCGMKRLSGKPEDWERVTKS